MITFLIVVAILLVVLFVSRSSYQSNLRASLGINEVGYELLHVTAQELYGIGIGEFVNRLTSIPRDQIYTTAMDVATEKCKTDLDFACRWLDATEAVRRKHGLRSMKEVMG